MIVTVHDLNVFEELVDFSKNIYYAWRHRNVGHLLPKLRLETKLCGIGTDGSLVLLDRVTMVSENKSRPDLTLEAGINLVVGEVVRTFEAEAVRLAEDHNCKAIGGSISPSPHDSHLLAILSQRIEVIEDRLLRLEEKVLPPLMSKGSGPSDHESRLQRLEGRKPIIEGS